MVAGRPTDYRDEYCQKIIDFFMNNDDATLKKFANHINTYTSTLFEWADKFPKFKESKKKALEIKRESLLSRIESLITTTGDIKVNSVALVLCARAYGIKTKDDDSGKNDTTDQDFSNALKASDA